MVSLQLLVCVLTLFGFFSSVSSSDQQAELSKLHQPELVLPAVRCSICLLEEGASAAGSTSGAGYRTLLLARVHPLPCLASEPHKACGEVDPYCRRRWEGVLAQTG